MAGSYVTAEGAEHARTMQRYHEDLKKTGRAMVIAFSGVTVLDGWLWLENSHPAFGFGAIAGAVLVAFGVHLHIRHGRKMERWQLVLDRFEAARRDRMIHLTKGWSRP